jgi:hypothetical protein
LGRWRVINPSLFKGQFTAVEDASLMRLVEEHGNAWSTIAQNLVGGLRSNMQCRTRWQVIDPSLSTVRFSVEEDDSLTELVAIHGTAWTVIASKLVGGKRSDKQCLVRYKALDPSLRKDKFSAAEDSSLLKLVKIHGKAWTLIASLLVGGGRNDIQCANRFKIINPEITPETFNSEKFSVAEDAQLVKLVGAHGKAWTMIASQLHKRSSQQCYNRWRILDPTLSKDKFSAKEDASLLKLVAEHGTSWNVVASKLVGSRRSSQQCYNRFRSIDPSLEKGDWSKKEDASLKELVGINGKAWTMIARRLVERRRNAEQCFQRWKAIGKDWFVGEGNVEGKPVAMMVRKVNGGITQKAPKRAKLNPPPPLPPPPPPAAKTTTKRKATKKKAVVVNDADSDDDDDEEGGRDAGVDFFSAMASAAPVQHQLLIGGGGGGGEKGRGGKGGLKGTITV